MNLLRWMEKEIHPPGIYKSNRRKLYSLIARTMEKLVNDSNLVFRDHFPALCSPDRLEDHGKARRIPRFSFDTDESFRERLASGSFTLDRTGEYGTFKAVMDQMLPDRWKYIEYPQEGFTIGYSPIGRNRFAGDSRVTIFIKDMTQEDSDNVYEFLDWFLGADIQIKVVNWEFVPYPPVSLEELRRRGGAPWLEEQLEDIAETSCEIMPDDAFVLEKMLIPSRIWDGGDTVLIYVDNQHREKILQRLEVVLSETVNRRIIDIQFKGVG